jgi:hypothetical protein
MMADLGKNVVDRRIKGDALLGDQAQHAHCKHGLGNGPDLEAVIRHAPLCQSCLPKSGRTYRVGMVRPVKRPHRPTIPALREQATNSRPDVVQRRGAPWQMDDASQEQPQPPTKGPGTLPG